MWIIDSTKYLPLPNDIEIKGANIDLIERTLDTSPN